tara:strand:- start:48 stop:323 length:276 start_codon:yes stop_codon:yes gene_type:complete
MQAELNGETKPVLRQRRGVIWCPHCDRSCQDTGGEQYCDGCHAKFTDDAAEASAPARRNRRAEAVEATEVAEEEPIELEDVTILIAEEESD